MKNRHRAITVALCIASISAAAAADRISGLVEPAIRSLLADSGGRAEVLRHRTTGVARVLRMTPGSISVVGDSVDARAVDFLERYGAAFGISSPAQQLVASHPVTDRIGATHLSFLQRHEGVPVFGAMLRVHFNASSELTAVNGTFVPEISLTSVEPSLSSESAAELAVDVVGKQFGSHGLAASASTLYVFRSGLVRGVPGADHLVWEIEVSDGGRVREFVYVDAHHGTVVDQIAGTWDIDRVVNKKTFSTTVWQEGDPLPYFSEDELEELEVNSLIDTAEDTYNLFLHLSGGTYRSWNGADALLRMVYDADVIDFCPNAISRGPWTAFCIGTAADDVVAHEWAHSYTSATHDLIYQWQPGALNESYSDIFGETIDILNGNGTDEPGNVRTVGNCSAAAGIDAPNLTVHSPSVAARDYEVASAAFNPLPPWSVTGAVEAVDDGEVQATDACEPLVDFTPGNIAFIEFGRCLFQQPVENAESAGASGVVLMNTVNDNIQNMMGNGSRLSIPAVMVGKSDGEAIRAALEDGLSATLSSQADASLRWLIGEDAIAFGNPIRDMWHPNCNGHPGSVTDSAYWCLDGDSGGVHINSGVPNHAYALLVDGGVYNGRSVTPIGLTKAAHIYWRAMTVYQVETSDFLDHADLLELSCSDLLGTELTDLETGASSGQVIEAFDCVQLSEAIAAVELRTAPSACNHSNVLDPEAPAFRADRVVYEEEFDSQPGGWTLSNEGVTEDYMPRDWVWTDQLPRRRPGGAFFADNDAGFNFGCSNNDQSSVLHLDSPQISLPEAVSWTVVFDHYIQTETGWDGGNIKISVNGGPFELIPAAAFRFNDYNTTLVLGENTNPLAGQPAFSGVDGGGFQGRWGQSQIDLGALAGAGDVIQLRFDFGIDACTHVDGWYLDSFRVVAVPRVLRGGGRVTP